MVLFETDAGFNVTQISVLTGDTHTRHIPITLEQYVSWRDGALIQDVMPDLSAGDREFMISGITPEEWEAM